jgi:hypothetical protein
MNNAIRITVLSAVTLTSRLCQKVRQRANSRIGGRENKLETVAKSDARLILSGSQGTLSPRGAGKNIPTVLRISQDVAHSQSVTAT